MGVAPTLISYTETSWVGNVSSVTTASLSWDTGDVIVCLMASAGANTLSWSTPTTTGTGLTFTLAKGHNTTATDCGAAIYTAVAAATSSGTVTEAPTSSFTNHIGLGVYVARGSAGVGSSALGTGTGRTVSLAPTGADGMIVWGAFDWSASANQGYAPASPTTHSTSAPGPNASPHEAVDGTEYTFYVAELDDQTSAGAVSYGIGGSGAAPGPLTIVACEVKAGVGGGGAHSAPLVVPSGAAQRASSW